MPDWSKLVDHLDTNSKGQDIVPIAFDTVAEIVGPLPPSAYKRPKSGVGYWKTEHVALGPSWVTATADWHEQQAYFRRLQDSPEADDASNPIPASVNRSIQDMLEELHDTGAVTSVVVTRQLADGTELRLTVEPRSEGQDRHAQGTHGIPRSLASSHNHGDASPLVSSGRPIREIASQLAPDNSSIHGDDSRPFRWRASREWVDLDKGDSYRRFKEKIRRHVRGLDDRPWLGGHGVLATMSRKKSEQTGEVAAYNPAALGLRRTTDATDLYNLVVQGKLAIDSIKGQGLNKDSIQIQVTNVTPERINLHLAVGTVFEQQDAPDVQDLVVRRPLEKSVEAGKDRLIKAYGLCMDEGGRSPNGEALLLTPWLLAVEPRLMADDVDSQDEIWAVTEGRSRQESEAPKTRTASGRKPRVQVTVELARQILEMHKDGHSGKAIAVETGVSTGTVYRVLNREHPICAELGEVRLVDNDNGMFHVKLVLLRSSSGSLAWVGSANFTKRGFGSNEELIYETKVAGRLQEWFDRRWEKIGAQADQPARYCNEWKRPESLMRGVDDEDVESGAKVVTPSQSDRNDVDDGSKALVFIQEGLRPPPYVKGGNGRRFSPHGKVEIDGNAYDYASAQECLQIVLEALQQRNSSFLRRCSADERFRKRGMSRYIARTKPGLGSEAFRKWASALHRSPASRSRNGWWLSNKTQTREKWKLIEAAADVAKLDIEVRGKRWKAEEIAAEGDTVGF